MEYERDELQRGRESGGSQSDLVAQLQQQIKDKDEQLRGKNEEAKLLKDQNAALTATLAKASDRVSVVQGERDLYQSRGQQLESEHNRLRAEYDSLVVMVAGVVNNMSGGQAPQAPAYQTPPQQPQPSFHRVPPQFQQDPAAIQQAPLSPQQFPPPQLPPQQPAQGPTAPLSSKQPANVNIDMGDASQSSAQPRGMGMFGNLNSTPVNNAQSSGQASGMGIFGLGNAGTSNPAPGLRQTRQWSKMYSLTDHTGSVNTGPPSVQPNGGFGTLATTSGPPPLQQT